MKKFSLNKNERIKHRKTFEEIFQNGEVVYKGFIRINFKEINFEDKATAKVAFAVPKKKFKRAYKRNRIKRMMREIYRLNKPQFYEILTQKNTKIALLFVYLSDKIEEYKDIEKNMLSALEKLEKKI